MWLAVVAVVVVVVVEAAAVVVVGCCCSSFVFAFAIALCNSSCRNGKTKSAVMALLVLEVDANHPVSCETL